MWPSIYISDSYYFFSNAVLSKSDLRIYAARKNEEISKILQFKCRGNLSISTVHLNFFIYEHDFHRFKSFSNLVLGR